METNIKNMDAQALRAALNAENCRIEGANVMREKVQMWAIVVGILGAIIITFCLLKDEDSRAYLILILWAGCSLVYWRNKPKSLHYFRGDNWEDEAREVLSQVEWEKFQRSRIKREAENEDN
jgi:hypothetical protein